MRIGVVRGLDLAPLMAAVVAVVMAFVYVRVVSGQDGEPLPWVLAILGVGVLSCAYGASMAAPHRQVVLVGSAIVLGVLGLLAILTIGLPILAAGGLALLGASRGRQPHQPPPPGFRPG